MFRSKLFRMAAVAAALLVPAACSSGAGAGDGDADDRRLSAPVSVSGELLPTLDVTQPVDAAVGTPAPVLSGVSFDGTPVKVDPAADGPTMVVFVAHWCPHCQVEVPQIVRLAEQGRLPEGLNVVAVSTAANATRPNFPPQEWLEQERWPFPVLVDEFTDDPLDPELPFVAAHAYGLAGLPFVTLVDSSGDVAARWAGEAGADAIDELIDMFLPELTS